MDYSLRELECFVAVAETLSFTRAAKRLHLSQPPLSRHVRTLEEKIGARLFDRDRRTVALTPAGALFYEETRGLLPQLVRAGESARRAVRGETARLRLGFVSAVLSAELVECFRQFRTAHPATQIMLHDAPPAEQLAAMEGGALDGGFIGLMPPGRHTGFRFVPWRREPLDIFLPAGHPLALRKGQQRQKRLELAELREEPFVAVSGESAPAFAVLVREACRTAGFVPRILLESPRAQAVAVMVAAGCGIALLPRSLSRTVEGAAVAVPLRNGPVVTHVFAYPARRKEALEPFLAALR